MGQAESLVRRDTKRKIIAEIALFSSFFTKEHAEAIEGLAAKRIARGRSAEKDRRAI